MSLFIFLLIIIFLCCIDSIHIGFIFIYFITIDIPLIIHNDSSSRLNFTNIYFRLSLDDIIIIGSVTYDVIGTAQHKLWLRKSEDPQNGHNSIQIQNSSSLQTPLREKEKEVEKEQEQIRNNNENKKKFLGLTRMTLDQILSQTDHQIIKSKEYYLNNMK